MSEFLSHDISEQQTLESHQEDFSVGETIENQEVELTLPDEVLTKLERARWDESKGDQQEELQKSQDYILSLPLEEQTALYDLINAAGRDLGRYIQENGFIINTDTQLAFNSRFGDELQQISTRNNIVNQAAIEVDESAIEVDESAIEVDESAIEVDEKISERQDIFLQSREIFGSQVERFGDIPRFQELIGELNNLDTTDAGEIERVNNEIKNFLQNPTQFARVVEVYAELGKQENPDNPFDSQVFRDFSSHITSLDPSFSVGLERYMSAPASIQDLGSDLHQAQIVAGLGGDDFSISGNIAHIENADGSIVSMDMSDVPPTRSIQVEGSNFSMDTELPVGDFYSAISGEGLAYEKVTQENTPKISILSALSGQEIQDFIGSEDFQKESFQNILRILSTMLGVESGQKILEALGGNINSKEDLLLALNPSGILAQRQRLQEEIDEKKAEYKDVLAKKVQEYAQSIEQKDEMIKEVLQFLNFSGIDLIPQATLDQIIARININPKVYGFDTPIDFLNGELGMDKNTGDSEGLEMKDKKAFIDTFDIMLGGGILDSDNLDRNASPVPDSDLSRFQITLLDRGIQDMGAAASMLQRLKNRDTKLK